MEKHSKRYRSAIQVADLTKEYPLKEAVDILAKFPKAKFDETVELSFRLGVDATAGEQMVRGTTPLPNGSGKKVRVLVFTDNPKVALDAGADFAGLQEMMQKVKRRLARFRRGDCHDGGDETGPHARPYSWPERPDAECRRAAR